MARQLKVLAEGFSFLEGPRWHEGRLYCSDFYTQRVLCVTPDGAVETVVGVPNQPSGLGWLPDGTMLIVSMKDRKLLRLVGGKLVEHADLSGLAPSHLNDMVVDEQGRAWVGNFGSDILSHEPTCSTNFIRVDPDGSATVVAEDMVFPNGVVITPDGRTLIVAETLGNRIAAFDIEADGSLSNRREFARFGDLPTINDLHKAIEAGQLVVAPDGMTLDAEGAVWAADALGARAIRVAGGEIVDEVSTAELGLGVFSCALGGDDGRTLHLMAAPTFDQETCKANHKAAIVTTTVDVPHAGLP
jgi:sugar lactone lactonase YvrE